MLLLPLANKIKNVDRRHFWALLDRQTVASTATLPCSLFDVDRYISTIATRSTQPCIPPGSLNRVPASAGVRTGMSPLPGGR